MHSKDCTKFRAVGLPLANYWAFSVWDPAEGWGDVLGKVIQNAHVHIDAHLVRDCQHESICRCDSWIGFELFDENIGFGCVGTSEGCLCGPFEHANLIFV